MRTILITGAGGSASTNYVRSLRLAKEKFNIIGADYNKFYLQRAETDKRYLVPRADHPDYISALNRIILENRVDFIHAQNDAEVCKVAVNKDNLICRTFMPKITTVLTCQNKWESREAWELSGIEHPKTFLIKDEDSLMEAFSKIKGAMWIRDIQGAGGKGSLKTDDFQVAEEWIKFKQGWGIYTIAEYLSERSTTFTTIWKDGLLIAGQGRKRLYWELGPAFLSGVSGATGAGATDNDPLVADMAIKAILAIDKEPNGIFSVDMTYGQDNVPYPTEINIGRFFTTHFFFAKAGFNMALIYTRLGLGEKIGVQKINPLKEGLVWIRGMDFEPVLTTMEKINAESLGSSSD